MTANTLRREERKKKETKGNETKERNETREIMKKEGKQ